MKLRYILLMITPALLLASGGSEGGPTDILPRTINFAIFAAIMYYLVAEPAKNFYFSRKAGIAEKLDSIQSKLKESNNAKEKAQKKVEEAKANAKSLIETSKKEAQLLSEKIIKETQNELANLDKAFQERTEIERRKMTREVVNNVLDQLFDGGSIALDKEELVTIVMKKVA
ncbi:MAG: F-type H+-transporting ATPase subunit b [Sulfurospirillum sp.]|nr:F-type H+-transporting ATPase subunit b [Sulfurospirillum sp.]